MSSGPTPDCRIVDTHVHIYPDAVAPKVAAKIGLPSEAEHPERLMARGIVEAQKRAGISLSVNMPVATRPEQVDGMNEWVKAMPEGIVSFAALHPDTPDKASVLRKIKADGFKGIKFHPEFQQFRLDDPRMLGCWEEMASLGLVAYFHAGGDRSFEPPFHTTPRDFRDFVRRFPALKVVAAHMGGYQMWYDVETDLCGESLWFDLSQIFVFGEVGQITRLIRKHGAERVLFASDSPWHDPAEDVRAFMTLPLEARERELILHVNAERLMGLS